MMSNVHRQQAVKALVTYLTLAGLLIGALFPFYWIIRIPIFPVLRKWMKR